MGRATSATLAGAAPGIGRGREGGGRFGLWCGEDGYGEVDVGDEDIGVSPIGEDDTGDERCDEECEDAFAGAMARADGE